VVGANYGALEGPASNLAMDWGTLIPLWFLLTENRLEFEVVIVTPSRGIPLAQNLAFGKVVARAAERERKRVAFVASADQAHAHRKDGPYGFSKEARTYDEKVIAAVKSNRLSSVLSMSRALVESAKPDSLWQIAMLAGALEVVPMKADLLSYEVPTYFGMLCASFSME
jgi:aromatic ring-opening dioxygenase LigB subunit